MSSFIHSIRVARTLFHAATLLFILLFFGFSLAAQTCTVSATTPTVAAEGLAEQIGTYTFTCNGGTTGTTVRLTLFAAASVNITNRVDANGVPTGLTIFPSAGVFVGSVAFYAATTLEISQVSYTVPANPATNMTVAVSGIRAAVATAANGTTGAIINGSALVIGAQFSAPSSFPVALTAPTLLTSNINNGIPCGSPVPVSFDFPTFLATGTSASAIRITEASPAAFAPKIMGADNGVRILVNLSGYTTGSRVFVPDAIVGSDAGATPTTTGLFGSTPSAGIYTPGNNQLLLLRVNGADATGTGGTTVLTQPLAQTTFSTVSELILSGGATYAVYEVVDSNPNLTETAQIPVWVASPSTPCSTTAVIPTFSPMVAPVSTVSIATQTDPIPRYLAVTPGTDCMAIGDCSANYFPTLSVSTTPIVFASPSLGTAQQTSLPVGNSGGGLLGFTVAVSYQTSPSGWLTVTPTSGQNSATLQITASPAMLTPGTYNATITVTAGTMTAAVPITFNVGPVGVTIQNVGNAASFQYGTVAPGSYAVIFGLNLMGVNSTSVAFNGVGASIVYSSPSQINVIVPTNLTNTLAGVVVTADGMASTPFRVTLANFPGIFSNGIVNASNSQPNTQSNPVTRGQFVTVYLTGLVLPLTGPVTVNIGSQTNLMPSFAGPQGSFAGLDQVNVTVPAALPASPNPVPLTVCIPGTAAAPVCSNAVSVFIQ